MIAVSNKLVKFTKESPATESNWAFFGKRVNFDSQQKIIFMPVISMFYGIIIRMFYFDNKEHHLPHIHVEYSGQKAVVGIPDGNLLTGSFPAGKLKLVQAWVEIHEDELMANWQLATQGSTVFKIDALK